MNEPEEDDPLRWLRNIGRFQHRRERYEITDLGRAALRDYEGLFHEHLFLRQLEVDDHREL